MVRFGQSVLTLAGQAEGVSEVDADREVLRKTSTLVDFLAELAAAVEPDPIRAAAGSDDAGEPPIWLDDLPDGVRGRRDAADGVILRLRPPHPVPEPAPGPGLSGWLDTDQPRGADGPEPELLSTGPASVPAD